MAAAADEYPLSRLQRRLWLLNRIDPSDTAYNVVYGYRFLGRLRVEALLAAVDTVLRRHDALRTTIACSGDEPYQLVLPVDAVPACEVVDVSGAPDPEAALHDIGERCSAEPIDLVGGRLFHCRLVVTAPDEHVLVVAVHHIVFDRLSLNQFSTELFDAYRTLADGQPPDLPEPGLQYGQYALWEQGADRRRVAEDLAYWRDRLAGAPPFLLLPQRPDPTVPARSATTIGYPVPADLAARLTAFTQAHGVTLYALGAAVFAAVLGRLAGQNDVVLGTQLAGRTRADLERSIGFYINTLPLRIRPRAGTPMLELVRVVGADSAEQTTRQRVTLEQIVNVLRPPRDPRANPVFQAVFQAIWTPGWQGGLPGLTLAPFRVHRASTHFHLNMNLYAVPGTDMHGILSYRRDLFDPTTMRTVVDEFLCTLRATVADPDHRVAAASAPPGRRTVVRNVAVDIDELVGRLCAVPGVAVASVVVSVESRCRRHVLVAFVRPVGQSPPHADLLAVLPTHLLPCQVEFVDELPTRPDPSGVIALPQPEPGPQQAVARIWAEVLGEPPASVRESLFSAGGNSLSAATIAARVRAEFGVAVELRTVLDFPTVASFCRRLAELGNQDQ